ncbi:MAG: hypothetical protein CM15mP120_10260 [Pseudomonadota bacterium]|nr:MAG: hypothetical protein CM15mP120_10260 [Pseudomonadota bacterium]
MNAKFRENLGHNDLNDNSGPGFGGRGLLTEKFEEFRQDSNFSHAQADERMSRALCQLIWLNRWKQWSKIRS